MRLNTARAVDYLIKETVTLSNGGKVSIPLAQ